jgi:hypothetical protein
MAATVPATIAADMAHVSQAVYIPNALALMSLQQVIALDAAIQPTTRAPQTISAAAPLLIPALAQLMQQQASLEASIKGLEEAIEVSFTENYYGAAKFELDPFFDAVTDRLDVLQREAANAAEVQRQVALLAPAPAAAVADDMDL